MTNTTLGSPIPDPRSPFPVSSPYELLCFGNALVDVFATVDAAWLDKRGITEAVQHIPRGKAQELFEELKEKPGAEMVLSSGGAAANTAKVAALLGMKAAFCGCVCSSDELASFFEDDLRAAGVDPVLAKGSEKTGLCFAFNCGGGAARPESAAQSGSCRIAASPGASLEFNEAAVRDDLIPNAEAIVLDGYILERRPLVQHILQLASHCGIPITIDAASVFQIREKTEDILLYSRNYPLIIFMNADESIVFYNTIKKGVCAPEISGDREKESFILREICPVLKFITEGDIFPIIVIKLGSRGAVVLAGGNIYREETFSIIPRNTIGAGDAFCAAFTASWIRGRSIHECASLGNKVARVILEVPGTRIKSSNLKSFAKILRKP